MKHALWNIVGAALMAPSIVVACAGGCARQSAPAPAKSCDDVASAAPIASAAPVKTVEPDKPMVDPTLLLFPDPPPPPGYELGKKDPAWLPPFAEPVKAWVDDDWRAPESTDPKVRQPSHEQGVMAVVPGVTVRHHFAPDVRPSFAKLWFRISASSVLALQSNAGDRKRPWIVDVNFEGGVERSATWGETLRPVAAATHDELGAAALGVDNANHTKLFVYDGDLRLKYMKRFGPVIPDAAVTFVGERVVVLLPNGGEFELRAYDFKTGAELARRRYPANVGGNAQRALDGGVRLLRVATVGSAPQVVEFDADMVPIRRHGRRIPVEVNSFEPALIFRGVVAADGVYEFDRALKVESRKPADAHLAQPFAIGQMGRVLTADGWGAPELGKPLTRQLSFNRDKITRDDGDYDFANAPLGAHAFFDRFILLTRVPCLRITHVRYTADQLK